MRFTCLEKDFAPAFCNVSLAVAKNSPVSAYNGILLRCRKDQLSMTGYDLDLSITKTIAVRSDQNGEAIIPPHVFYIISLSNATGSDREIKFTLDETFRLQVDAGLVSCSDVIEDMKEYPMVPTVDKSTPVYIPRQLLEHMIASTIRVFVPSDLPPVIAGMVFDIERDSIHLTAVNCDQFVQVVDPAQINGRLSFAVPRKAAQALYKILFCNSGDEYVEINADDMHVSFSVDGYVLISQILNMENFRKRIDTLSDMSDKSKKRKGLK